MVESLPLWRGAHFLEAANLKPLPSQWDALQGASWRELENVAEPLELLLKCFSFFENSWFFPRDPLRSLGWLTFENSWFFCDFQIARATLCGVLQGRIALLVARRSF